MSYKHYSSLLLILSICSIALSKDNPYKPVWDYDNWYMFFTLPKTVEMTKYDSLAEAKIPGVAHIKKYNKSFLRTHDNNCHLIMKNVDSVNVFLNDEFLYFQSYSAGRPLEYYTNRYFKVNWKYNEKNQLVEKRTRRRFGRKKPQKYSYEVYHYHYDISGRLTTKIVADTLGTGKISQWSYHYTYNPQGKIDTIRQFTDIDTSKSNVYKTTSFTYLKDSKGNDSITTFSKVNPYHYKATGGLYSDYEYAYIITPDGKVHHINSAYTIKNYSPTKSEEYFLYTQNDGYSINYYDIVNDKAIAQARDEFTPTNQLTLKGRTNRATGVFYTTIYTYDSTGTLQNWEETEHLSTATKTLSSAIYTYSEDGFPERVQYFEDEYGTLKLVDDFSFDFYMKE